MKIPASFELYGCTWKIRIVDKGEWNDDTQVGICRFQTCEIFLLKLDNTELMGQVYCHEIVHAILEGMSSKLYDNEVFVDTFASLLHQIITTAE